VCKLSAYLLPLLSGRQPDSVWPHVSLFAVRKSPERGGSLSSQAVGMSVVSRCCGKSVAHLPQLRECVCVCVCRLCVYYYIRVVNVENVYINNDDDNERSPCSREIEKCGVDVWVGGRMQG
jgi:hypothetical protein